MKNTHNIEHMMVSQRKKLTRWVRSVIIGIEDETVCSQEVEVAMDLEEELNTTEESLVQMHGKKGEVGGGSQTASSTDPIRGDG